MQNLNYFIFFLFDVWLAVLSFFIYRYFILFNKLTKGMEVADLKKVFEKVLTRGDINTKDIKALNEKLDILEDDSKTHIQKVGLIRLNPFKELGGDHSFSLAILDAHDSGIIITGLHTRDRTRVYLKDIKKGKSEFELSDEERKALASAQKSK
jgi:hypothetical protein